MMENKVEHTNLKQDNDDFKSIAPKFLPETTPNYEQQLHEESVQWFTRFADEFAPVGGQPKYGVHDTMTIATSISARIMAYPLVAMRMKDGSPLPVMIEEAVITTYLMKLEGYIHAIIAKRDALKDQLVGGTGT